MTRRPPRPPLFPYTTLFRSLQRALDQVMMDVCLHKLPVTFVLDRAGITGDDGPSHHGIFDLTFLRAMPGLDRKSTRLNSSHTVISYAVFCLKKQNDTNHIAT